MSSFMSLAEAAARFAAAGRDVKNAEPQIVEAACKMVAARAKSVLGTEAGYGWPDVTPETRARKTMPGILLETGELRDSIQWNSAGNVGYVGSNLDRALFHELGTSKMPPRPWLAPSAAAEAPHIAKMAKSVLAAAFAGHGPLASRVHDIFKAAHILWDAAKKIGDDFEDVFGDERKAKR